MPQSIRTEHRSGFNNDILKQFCSSKGSEHLLSPLGDQRGSGFLERSINTIKRKLGTRKT